MTMWGRLPYTSTAGAIFAQRILVYNLGNTMIIATITKANKTTLQENGSEFLDVEFDLFEGVGTQAKLVTTKRLAFPLETDSKDVQSEVAAYAATFQSDNEAAERNKDRNRLHAKADATIETLLKKKEDKVEKEVSN